MSRQPFCIAYRPKTGQRHCRRAPHSWHGKAFKYLDIVDALQIVPGTKVKKVYDTIQLSRATEVSFQFSQSSVEDDPNFDMVKAQQYASASQCPVAFHAVPSGFKLALHCGESWEACCHAHHAKPFGPHPLHDCIHILVYHGPEMCRSWPRMWFADLAVMQGYQSSTDRWQ